MGPGEDLALRGGTPAVTEPLPPMYPGGMRIDAAEEKAVLEVLRSKRLFRYYGPGESTSCVDELERRFAEHIGARHCLAVNSGTSALLCGLAALGVGPGDEVVVPAYTFNATAAAVLAIGAVPVLAEINESLTMDPADVVRRISRRTKAIIPVHMRGTPADMTALQRIATEHDVPMLEDVAQAAGATFHGDRLGTLGAVGAFSLQFNKIITAGEGGLLVTNDRELYQRALMYHDVVAGVRHGLPRDVLTFGLNLRMSELQAAVANVQLDRLDGLLADMRDRKSRIRAGITEALTGNGIRFVACNDADGDAGIALVLLHQTPDQAASLVTALTAEGVAAKRLFDEDKLDLHIYYHWPPVLARRSWTTPGPWDWADTDIAYSPKMCPQTLDILGRTVHLDVSPDLTDRNVDEIIGAVLKVLRA